MVFLNVSQKEYEALKQSLMIVCFSKTGIKYCGSFKNMHHIDLIPAPTDSNRLPASLLKDNNVNEQEPPPPLYVAMLGTALHSSLHLRCSTSSQAGGRSLSACIASWSSAVKPTTRSAGARLWYSACWSWWALYCIITSVISEHRSCLM